MWTLWAGVLFWVMVPAHAAPDGARLFAQNCAACHGENGSGGIGVPLALPSFQATISDAYVRQTIKLGRPGRIMPAFTGLKPNEIDAIVRFVRTWNKARPVSYPVTLVIGDATHGKQLFGQHCAVCHGATGEGGKGTGVTFSRPRDLPIMAPALRNAGFLAAATDGMIKATLIKGREGTPMVSFAKQGLSEVDINDITSYVRSFERMPDLSSDGHIDATEPPILSVDSPYDLGTTIKNVKEAAISHNFNFIREQTLDSDLVPAGTENPAQHLVYICSFSVLNQALASDPRVGMFLPCRITVVEDKGKVRMYSVNPKRLSRVFNNTELNGLCDAMKKNYLSIMEEAAL
jgi:cytochrome c oxidase cbb3-type subunit 3